MRKIGVLLTKNYKLLSIAAILEVFETVNKFHADEQQEIPFKINLLGVDNAIEKEAFGYPIKSIHDSETVDLILIPAFTSPNMPETLKENSIYIPYLLKQFQKGASIGTVCTGAFLLGASGLLNGKIATTHVDACSTFALAFPEVKLKADKTVTQDGRLYTSGGATSSFHLLLHIIHEFCGNRMAVKTAKLFAIDMDRDKQSYFSTFQPSKNHKDELVASAQQKIESNYHDTATIEELIKDIPSSRRNIVRRFKQITGITPIEYLQQTRIEAAKKLLERTTHQMNEVIFQSGYSDPKAFRKMFKKNVGMTPSQYRDKFQVR
ncbi:GlxA family transcriptional regulator [Pedobacter insulae]|uniref:Transcriptional regulator GlxA family, contains an amidase domain and an AraC-type DNA-binding HTH domain n=1 Tax=Pedobacter insulae TaxID=414048 RepID=A0A1I3A7Y7_9SPHI|nr:helix-turn-helix domain-containing protein [Pedobacter insulae]SFH46030.1 Transcriptional regulator GlxA family, contains an amidase domain and an AraC-type DNA-binding HTH domain [Pedobacter insulae]